MHMRPDDTDGTGGPPSAEEAEVRQRGPKEANGAAAGPEVDGATGTSTQQDGHFECNICLDTAKDAVVSRCGHLFCWPCLYQWLETRPNRQTCPVCKAGISKDNVIPLYGRGSTNQQDPREKLPPRPQGERPEPENHGPFHNFGIGDGGFQMSFGIGAFPFGFFASTFNIGNGQFGGHPPRPNVPQNPEEQFLSKVFLWVAVLFMFWLLMA